MNFYKKLQSQKTEFRDEYKTKQKYQAGQMFSLWSNKHELCSYNKIAEIKKDKQGVNFLQSLNLSNRQVLRIEYRLFKKSTIKQTLIENGFNKTPTFKDIFDMKLCQTILFNKWTNIIQKRMGQLNLLSCNVDPLIDALFNGQKQARTILCALGVMYLIKIGYSLTEIEQTFPKNSQYLKQIIANVNYCQNITKSGIKMFNKKSTSKSNQVNKLIPAFNYIDKTLSNYNPIRPNTVI